MPKIIAKVLPFPIGEKNLSPGIGRYWKIVEIIENYSLTFPHITLIP